MEHESDPSGILTLEQAQIIISEQAREIERLRERLAHENFAQELGDALLLANSAGTIASPVSHSKLLELIVRTAVQVIDAEAGSLLLIDEVAQELVFEVTLGEKADLLLGTRMSLGEGVAGLVAVSGQPIIIQNTDEQTFSAIEIAERIAHLPRNLLCVPLTYSDGVIGVMEIIDKQNNKDFSQADVHTLSLFANLAAVAIRQSNTHRNLPALVSELVVSSSQMSDNHRTGLEERIDQFTTVVEGHASYKQALELASLVHEVTWRGQSEAETCRTLLKGFADFLRKQNGEVR